jgi:hypothetical protein
MAVFCFLWVVYETVYPVHIATFHAVRIPDKVYRAGDLVQYEVELTKYHDYDAHVMRVIRCKDATFYRLAPDQIGSQPPGYRVAKPFLVIPQEITSGECYLETTYTYRNINLWHKPVRYQKDSNWFRVRRNEDRMGARESK